jgi:N-acetylmuramoyl-L-alanine amidase-like protein
MAKIPTAAALQEPQIGDDRRAALADPRTAAAPATALVEAGKAMGLASDEFKRQQEQNDELDGKLLALEHIRAEQQRLDKDRREMARGGAGFTDSFRARYDEGAKAVAQRAAQQGLSLRARQHMNYQLLAGAMELENRASRYQEDEEDRHNHETISTRLVDVLGEVKRDPSLFDERRQYGELFIQRSPLNPARHPAVLERFRRDIEAQWHEGLRLLAATGPEGARQAREILLGRSPIPPGAGPRPRVPNRAGEAFTTPDAAPEAIPGERPEPRTPQPGAPASAGDISAVGAPPPPAVPEPQEPLAVRPVPGNRTPVGTAARTGGVSGIVMHHTSGSTLDSAISQNGISQTGYNYYVDRDGQVYQFAPDDRRINHIMPPGHRDRRPGASPDLSSENTIGIGVVARNDADVTDAQRDAVRRLTGQLVQQYGINRQNIVGHGELQHTREESEGSIARELRAAPSARGGAPQVLAASPAGPEGQSDFVPPRPMRLGSAAWAEAELQRVATEAPSQDPSAPGPLRSRPAQVRSTLNAINAEDQRRIAPLNDEIKKWETGARNGTPPPPDRVAQVRADIEEIGNPELAQNFNYMLALAETTRVMRRMPPAEMEKYVQGERLRQQQRGANELDIKRLDHMEALLEKARKDVNADAITWAHTVGLEDFSGRLNFDDDISMRTRVDRARRVAEVLGQQIQVFSRPERDRAADLLRQGGPAMRRMLGSIIRNFGTDAPQAIRELTSHGPDGKPQDPELAAVGGMEINLARNGVGQDAVERVANEIAARRGDNYERTVERFRPKPEEWRDAESVLDTAFTQRRDQEGAVIAAARLLYLNRARERNLTSFDPSLYRQGLMEIVGQNVGEGSARNVTYGGLYHQTRSFGGVGPRRYDPIPVPSNIRQDAIPLIQEVVRPEDLRRGTDADRPGVGPLDGQGRELTSQQLRSTTLVHVGGGRYWLAQNPPSSGAPANWVRDASGERFVLDLNALEPLLRERIPEIYRGYAESAAAQFRPQGFPRPTNVPGGPTAEGLAVGPDHPDYPKGDFAPRINPGRPVSRDEWIEFQRRLASYPRPERERIMNTRSLYWKALRDFIDEMPAQSGPR